MSDPLSLRGVFDIDRIEAVLRSFSFRLDQQQTQLSALTASNVNCEQTCEALKSGVDRALVDIDRRFAQFEARLHRYDSNQSRFDDMEQSVERWSRIHRDKADQSSLDEFTDKMHIEIERIYQNLDSLNEHNEALSRLDTSQRQLAKQLAALQELLSCKVDRVEVPLIQTAGERVKAADQFRLEAGPKIESIESKLDQLEQQIDSKEERSAVIERMQAIYKEFQNRPQKDDIEERLERPLEELRERYDSLQSVIGSVQPQKIVDQLDQSRSELKNLIEETRTLKSQLDRLSSQLTSRASVRLVDRKADKSYCEQLVHELALNCDEKIGNHAAVVDNIKNQILELKRIQNEVDGKLSVSLKFLDWFSTVQLEKQMSRAL